MTGALDFHNVQLDVIDRNGEPWVRGIQIGYALGYENPRQAIRKLFESNSDEFTPSMTALVKLPTEGGEQEVRIFSLRGCHLLAMFARTPVAKAFRRWVLDVLESLGKSDGKPKAAQRRALPSRMPEYLGPLRELQLKHLEGFKGSARDHKSATLRMRLMRRMGVSSIWRLRPDQVEEAMAVLTPPIGQQPWRDSPSAQEAPKEPKAPPIKDDFRPHKQSDLPRGFDRLADTLRDAAMQMDELANMCDAYFARLR